MTGPYFILEEGDQQGPYTLSELIDLQPDIHTRVLSPITNTWEDACDLPELSDYFLSMDVYFPTADNLASFAWRALAFIVDLFIVSFLTGILLNVLSGYGFIHMAQSMDEIKKLPKADVMKLQIIVYSSLIIYNIVGEISPLKGSIGKRLFKMVVVDADGVALPAVSSIIRSIGKVLSLFFWGIGFVSVFFTEHKQAVHDLLAKSYVVKRD